MGDEPNQLCAAGGPAQAHSRHSTPPTGHIFRRSVSDVSIDGRHELGHLGERLAAEHLQRLGYRIVERNYRTRWGELDIVAQNGTTLVFCEVKTRRMRAGDRTPLEAVHTLKQSRVRRMASSWLVQRRDRPYATELRFDAIGVTFDPTGRLASIEHLEGAF